MAARHHHHDRHLNFTKKVYLKQVYGGRHATIEQPKEALSWQTTALRDLPGRITDFSQRRYGAQCLDADDVWKPVLKNTRLLTTKKAVQEALCLQCQHDHEHCHLAVRGLWREDALHGRLPARLGCHFGSSTEHR